MPTSCAPPTRVQITLLLLWTQRHMQVVSARVCNQDGTVCDVAAALNSVVLVQVVAKNIGAIAADYTMGLGNCSYPAQPVPAQALALEALQEQPLVFQMYLTAPEGTEEAVCSVTMLDSQGEVTDEREVRFQVNATDTDELAVSDGTREALDGGDSGHRSCSGAILCSFVHVVSVQCARCSAARCMLAL